MISSSLSWLVLSSLLNHYCQLSLLLQKAAWCSAISAVNHACNVCAVHLLFLGKVEKNIEKHIKNNNKGLWGKVSGLRFAQKLQVFTPRVSWGPVASTFLEGISACSQAGYPNLCFTCLSSQMCQIYWGYPLFRFFRKLHRTVALVIKKKESVGRVSVSTLENAKAFAICLSFNFRQYYCSLVSSKGAAWEA